MLRFRRWQASDEPFLWEMLYQSLHVRDGAQAPSRTILEQPEIHHYLSNFGKQAGDDAQLALDEADLPIGAAWCRLMSAQAPGYGFVAEGIPELGMAVVARWRGRGVGRRLLEDLLERNPVMSLSVDDQNFGAERLYTRLGFVEVRIDGTAKVMLRRPLAA